jgi:glycosyltransferase involved in cell wall biosynthesis
LNLLVFTQYFWPENFRINDLVKGLLAKGIHVEVMTGQPNYPEGKVFEGYRSWNFIKTFWNDVVVYRLPLFPRGHRSSIRLMLNYLSFIVSGILLASFALRRKKVDIIFVYAISPILQVIPAIFLKWIKGAKLVVWVQDLWPESVEATGFIRNKWLLILLRSLVRWIYRHTDFILVQSEAFIEPVAALADRRKITYYPNSAEDIFSSALISEECPIKTLNNGFSIVFAGNLGAAQALDVILDAAALLKDEPEIRFFLVGSGSRADWVQDQIKMRGLNNVIMTGQYPVQSMPAIFNKASVLLVTLKDEPIFYHTVPSKLQVYLTTGRPIIACLNGEGARIVRQANAGLACPAEDANALAGAVRQMLALTDAERHQLGINGQSYFKKHYDSNMLIQVLISHFEKMLIGSLH